MNELLLPGDKTNAPQQTAVMLMVNRAKRGIVKDSCGARLGKKQLKGLSGDAFNPNPPNPLGRHPFNIITEEIYND